MSDFFSSKIGHQTIAFIVTVVSFPFLYLGGTDNNSTLLIIGVILMLSGMLAAPVITFFHAKKWMKKHAYKGSSNLETSSRL